MKLKASMVFLTILIMLTLCGAVSAANTPLNTTQNGTVSGDLYVNTTQPVPFADQPTGATTREFNTTYNIPTYTSIEYAKVYVNIYSGSGSANWPVNATILLDGNGDGVYETTLGNEILTSTNYSTDGTIYWINNHCFRVYSDYQLWYDVTGLINCTHPSIYVKTQQVGTDTFDGRLKMITLVAAYNDTDNDTVHYWVNDGQDWISSGETSQTTFETSPITENIASATLNTVALSSKDGSYNFNGVTNNGTDPVAPINYFVTHTWDVTATVTRGNNSTLTYTAGSGSFKSVLATLTIREGKVETGLADSPWPTFGGNLKGTGQSTYTGTEISNLAWKYSTGGAISSDSSATIGADGTIYIGSTDKKLYALNPDGTLKWTHTTGGSVYTPTIGSDGTIYIGSTDKKLYALNPDGTLKWNYTVGGSIQGAAKIGTDGTIYVAGGGLYALTANGTLKWSYGAGSYTPVIGTDGTIYVTSGSNLYAVNPDGTLKWTILLAEFYSIKGSPAIGPDGTIYVASTAFALHAVNPDGTLKWNYSFSDQCYTGSPVIGTDGTIYIGNIESPYWGNNFYAINSDGTLKWAKAVGTTSGHYIYGSAAIDADGTVYIGCMDGKFYAFNNNGILKWTFATGAGIQSSPSIGSDGTIYIGSSDGKLYALNIIPPVANFTADVLTDYAPLTVQFTDTSTENPSSWQWDFNNDGTIDSTQQNPTYTYTTPGTYTVKLVVSNKKGNNSMIKTDYITVTITPNDTESPTVTASPISGNFNSIVTVTLTAIDNFDKRPVIYYTTDGTDPTTESRKYTGNITLVKSTILKFIAADKSGNISPVQTETYNVTDTYPPNATATLSETTVTLKTTDNADPNPKIYYTTDGTDPTTSSTPYSGPFTIPPAASTIVKFIAVDESGNTSPLQSKTFNTTRTTDIITGYYAEGNIGLIVSNGGTSYTWFAHNTPGTGTVTYTASDLNIPEGATILSARLYQAWTWYGYPGYTLTFNGNSVNQTAHYADGNDGQDIFDVTKYFKLGGNNTAVLTSTGGASYATILIVVYQLDSEPYKEIWVNEGFDIIPGYSGYGATEGPGHAYFKNVTTNNISTAQITLSLPSGDNDSPSILLNGQTFNINSTGGSDPAFKYYNINTTAIGNGTNIIEVPNGGYMSIANAILTLTYQSDIVANFTADKTNGTSPLTVQFTDQSTNATSWSWDFNNDGIIDSTEQNPTWTYTTPDSYTVKLKVTGPGGIDTETKNNYITIPFATWHDACESLDGWITSGSSLSTTAYEGSFSINGNAAGSTVSAQKTINILEGAKTLRFEAGATTSYSYDNWVKVYLDGQEILTIPLAGSVNWNRYAIDLSKISPGNHTFKIQAYSETSWASANFFLDNIWVIGDEEIFSNIKITPADANVKSGNTLQLSAQAYSQYDGKLSKVFTWTSSNESVGTINSNGLFTALTPGTTYITATADGINCTQLVTVNYPVPVAEFTSNVTQGLTPLSVQFTDTCNQTVPGTITSWNWDFNGDGITDSTEQNPTWTYNSTGTHTVKLTVSGPGGSDEEVKTNYITVFAQEPPIAQFTSNIQSGFEPFTVHFTDQSSNYVTGWAWDFDGDGITDSTLQNPTHTFYAGNYTVKLTVTGPLGTDEEVKTNYVTVNYPAPVAGFTATTTMGITPLPVQFNSTSTGTITHYAWDFNGDGITDSTEQNPTYTYQNPGTYTVKLTVTGPGGTDEEVKTNYISAGTIIYQTDTDSYVLSTSANNNYGTSTTIYARVTTSGGIYRTLITFDLSSIPKGAVIDSATLYAYMSSRAGDRNISAYRITGEWTESGVKWNNQPTVNSIATSITNPGSVANVWVTWDVTPDVLAYLQGTANYGWMLALSNESSSNQYAYFRSSEYSTTAQRPYLQIVCHLPTPEANFTTSPTNGTTPLTVQFTDTTTNNPTTWAWDFNNDGNIDSTIQNPTWTYTSEGIYTVTLTAGNSAGNNTLTQSNLIKVGKPDLSIDNVQLPNNPVVGGIYNINATIVNNGVSDAAAFNVKIAGIGTQRVNSLAASTSTVLSWIWTPTTTGPFQFDINTDRHNEITEANEANNIYKHNVTVSDPRADITISDVNGIPVNPVVGQTYTITTTITNNGQTDATGFNVKFAGLGTQRIDSLAAGASTTLTWTWTPTAVGDVTFNINSDRNNEITEANENNNIYTQTVKVTDPRPDITITDVTGIPANPVAGQTYTVTVTVANNGSGDASSFNVKFAGNGTQRVTNLAAGATTTLTWTWTPTTTGDYNLNINTDRNNEITEANEANNIFQQTVYVG
ncbi:DUF3344 domain-containing protein [uncultured Methanobacterium sp.]|uniref:DUF3344 domain-containing protein n=1 Tax=uncultured Methanobacterium sp. TaxID=176306 RepID=UPI002AA632E1|nr:DUF3344 domain-containing protein [uncultured Methanobacterium sp.]